MYHSMVAKKHLKVTALQALVKIGILNILAVTIHVTCKKKINKYETAKRTIHNLKLQKLQLSHITLMNNTKNVQQNDKYWLIQNTILL